MKKKNNAFQATAPALIGADPVNERILDDMTVKEAIIRCGELQLPYEQVARLISEQLSVDRAQMLEKLQTQDTDEYEWYLSGFAEGNLRLRVDLESDIKTDQKDAYKSLSAERRRQALDEKIKDLFGS